jgi:hypothetical protein
VTDEELEEIAREIAPCVACHGTGFSHGNVSGMGVQLGPKCMPCDGTGHCCDLDRLRHHIEAAEKRGARREAERVRELEGELLAARREVDRWITGNQIEGDYVGHGTLPGTGGPEAP